MGLFKKNPAEKKLKELTGGFILSSDFIKRLENSGLKIQDGTSIQHQLKDEIKQGLDENQVEERLTQLINQQKKTSPQKNCPKCGMIQEADNTFCISCGFEFKSQIECPSCGKKQDTSNRFCTNCGHDFAQKKSSPEKKVTPKRKTCPNCSTEVFEKTTICPNCRYDFTTNSVRGSVKISEEVPKKKISTELDMFMRKTQFLTQHDYNLKTCPDCNTRFLKTDPFCFNCGASVVTHETEKNENLKVKDGKLTSSDSQHDELSDLEALYAQTVSSKYEPSFKVAYVLYLDEFRKNPTKKFSDKLAKHYRTTPNKLKKQALEDEFIERAPAISEAKSFKVTELKEILKKNNLKVSGKKDELINRLDENLTEDELKKYFKAKNYQISEPGSEFLSNNNSIIYIHENRDISRAFYPSEIIRLFEERRYDESEINDILIRHLSNVLDEKLNQERWIDYKIYSNALAEVMENNGDLSDTLKLRLKVFLFDLNNYSVALNRPDPKKLKLKSKDKVKLTQLLHKMTLPIDELKQVFSDSYNEVLFDMDISKDESFVYLLKIFGGENLDEVSSQIRDKYSNPY